eukprot:7918172-Pyramimonas_sp.AAC.1
MPTPWGALPQGHPRTPSGPLSGPRQKGRMILATPSGRRRGGMAIYAEGSGGLEDGNDRRPDFAKP